MKKILVISALLGAQSLIADIGLLLTYVENGNVYFVFKKQVESSDLGLSKVTLSPLAIATAQPKSSCYLCDLITHVEQKYKYKLNRNQFVTEKVGLKQRQFFIMEKDHYFSDCFPSADDYRFQLVFYEIKKEVIPTIFEDVIAVSAQRVKEVLEKKYIRIQGKNYILINSPELHCLLSENKKELASLISLLEEKYKSMQTQSSERQPIVESKPEDQQKPQMPAIEDTKEKTGGLKQEPAIEEPITPEEQAGPAPVEQGDTSRDQGVRESAPQSTVTTQQTVDITVDDESQVGSATPQIVSSGMTEQEAAILRCLSGE